MKYSIEQLDHAYHELGKPLVSDAEYDQIAIDRSTVGADVSHGVNKLAHSVPMLSITSKGSLTSFGISTRADLFLVEPKIDGVALSLDYVDGLLVSASTRGNGRIGRDVTDHALACCDVPNKLSESVTVTIRGELFMPLSRFGGEFATARNAVVGSIRLKDSARFADRNLSFYAFQIVGHDLLDQSSVLAKLSDLGLPVNPKSRLCTLDEFSDYFNYLESNRHSFDYDMDGVVIKVNDVAIQNDLGCTSTHPKWILAKKFIAAIAESTIIDIEYSETKSGRQTAVAVINPVQMMNKTITRINLYNPMNVSQLGAGIGSEIVIQMKNDVIAQLKHVVTKMPYSGPMLPEKLIIGPKLTVDMDKLYSMLD